jgi:hypothetical protein
MNTFREYSDSFTISCDSKMLDLGLNHFQHCIFNGSEPLLTPGGNIFSDRSEGLMRLIITDLQLSDGITPDKLQSPLLYSFGKDILNGGDDPFLIQWEKYLSSDPFVSIKVSGKSAVQPYSPDDHLFEFSFNTMTGLIGVINTFAARVMSEVSMEESDSHPFPSILRISYERLYDDQKVAVQALSSVHQSGIVLPLLVVLGEITPVEYVKGLIALQIQPEELTTENLGTVARVQAYLCIVRHKPENTKSADSMIREGEGDAVEFKSTLRWDIRAGKTNPAIERSCLKTISAFLNSSGGSLLIGIRDDGSVEGIDTDKFANEDKFLLHLWTLIRNCLGRDFSPFIRTRLEKRDEKFFCVVDCLPANRPVFLRQPGFDEEMFIRMGPSSNALDISEALRYIGNHFKNR